ncbi:MAG: N-sulfoglucosamine sulfohydrolase, partial [Rhodothermales bacterium]
DRLAAQGVLFENGYVTQSVCSPSRSSIFTGFYPHQNGQLGLATHKYGWFKKWPTTYSLLKQSGYRTGLIGKTHVIPADAVESYVDFRYQPSANFAKRRVADYAVKAGEFFRGDDEPFFMTVNYPDAHWPLQGKVDGLPESQVAESAIRPLPYVGGDNPRLRKVYQNYYDCMLRLDACVGQLLAQLEDSGKADNTLVIFVGDHGAQMARGKVTVYEGGMRVPFIARWPGRFEPGTRSKDLVSTIDLLPTFLDAAGLASRTELPGHSLLGTHTRNYLVCERNCDAAALTFPQRSIRDARYKLIHSPVRDREDPAARYYRIHGASHWAGSLTDDELSDASEQTKAGYARWLNPPEYQLYDLQADPYEWRPIDKPAVHERLMAALKDWQRDTADPIADSAKLKMLMDENDAVVKAKQKFPKGGWQYLSYLAPPEGKIVHRQREIPEGVPLLGHAEGASTYGYRIPSLLVTKTGSILAFSERRVGLHDHAQNDIVLRRSTDAGKTWGAEIVAFEDGMNSINDPLTVQLANGRILLMFARFPYGRHARDSGWIKQADLGYDDPKANVLTFLCHSDDDGLTWSKPLDISRQVKHPQLLNANTPGAMIQLTTGRVVAGLWGALPSKKGREWRNVVAYSDDNGDTWSRTDFLEDRSASGFGNECQVAEASNGDLVLISRNQGGERFRKKSISRDGGESWSALDIDRGLPSVACMGSVIKGPLKADGSWDLWASFPSKAGRKDGQIVVSRDNGATWQVAKVIPGAFAYSALQVAPDQQHLLCLYESEGYRTQTLLIIPFSEIDRPHRPLQYASGSFENTPAGPLASLTTSLGTWAAAPGHAEIDNAHAHSGSQCLRILGGDTRQLELTLSSAPGGQLIFQAERWTKRSPFRFRIEARIGDQWQEIYNGDSQIKIGDFRTRVAIDLPDAEFARLRFTSSSPANSGVMIDDLRFE